VQFLACPEQVMQGSHFLHVRSDLSPHNPGGQVSTHLPNNKNLGSSQLKQFLVDPLQVKQDSHFLQVWSESSPHNPGGQVSMHILS
jgi:hypothetical protein